jgi:hypothetical protein
VSSRPMLAAITAVLSRPSGLDGSMGAFCKGASCRSIRDHPGADQLLVSDRSGRDGPPRSDQLNPQPRARAQAARSRRTSNRMRSMVVASPTLRASR